MPSAPLAAGVDLAAYTETDWGVVDMPEPTVLCRVLGALAVRARTEDDFVELNADKQRRLLAELLLHHDTWVETDTLLDVLWDDANRPASARNNLKTYVHQLRQLLPTEDGNTRILSRRGSYLLSLHRDELDATAFEDLLAGGRVALRAGDAAAAVTAYQDTLALWRGEPFTQVPNPRAAAEADRLRQLRNTANEGLAEALIATGRAGEAVAITRPLTVREPLRESGWRWFIGALHADGRLAEALRAYHDARRTLVDELGAEPGPELRELHRTLLAETSAAPADPAPAPAAPAPVRRTPRLAILAGALVVLLAAGGFVLNRSLDGSAHPGPTAAAALRDYSGKITRRAIPNYPQPEHAKPKLLFGMGDSTLSAASERLVTNAPVNMLTTWYDSPQQQAQYAAWKSSVIPGMYRGHKALQLVVPTWDKPGIVRTKYGIGCGQARPLSPGFLDEMRNLARDFAGRADGPPLYVTMFYGLEKLACTPHGFHADAQTTHYYRALQDRYLEIVRIFHANAPNARVSLCWDSWIASSDDPLHGDGRSMYQYFGDAMRRSDFVSFSAFEPETNVEPIRDSVRLLSKYGPVMLAYYRPYGNSGPLDPAALRAYDGDLSALFSERSVRELTSNGLFAWSFWDDQQVTSADPRFARTSNLIRRYAAPAG